MGSEAEAAGSVDPKPRKKPARGIVHLLAGGALVLGSMFLLVPGLNEAVFASYTDRGGDLAHGVVLLALGAALLLPGAALLLVGFYLRRAYYNRRRTYADRSTDHTLTAEDRPENAHRSPGHGFQTGSF